MSTIKIKLNRILRNIGLEKSHIRLFEQFEQELRLDQFDEICFINLIENKFNIIIPDHDIPQFKTINNAMKYLTNKTLTQSGLN